MLEAARRFLVHHRHAKSYNKVFRLAGLVLLDPRFTRRQPVTLVRCQPAYFINFVKMVQVLDVATVMPAKHIRLFTVDQVCHCCDPLRVLDGCQPPVLCILNNLEHVTAFERITVIAGAAFYPPELGPGFTFFGW